MGMKSGGKQHCLFPLEKVGGTIAALPPRFHGLCAFNQQRVRRVYCRKALGHCLYSDCNNTFTVINISHSLLLVCHRLEHQIYATAMQNEKKEIFLKTFILNGIYFIRTRSMNQ